MPTSELEKYFPVLLQAIIAAVIAASLTILSSVLGKRSKSPQKDTPYECGMAPTGDAMGRFSIKFYLVAMIFILLDIEAVFLYPWAVVYRQLKWFAFAEMLLFILLVLVGYFYIWKKGALDWSVTDKVRRVKSGATSPEATIREAA
jgi:NADH-quinone oxidoreductase subunit A